MKLPKPDVDRNAKIFRTYPILVLCRVCQNSRAEWATDHSGGLLPWIVLIRAFSLYCIINNKVWLRLFFRRIVHRGEKLVEGEVVEFTEYRKRYYGRNVTAILEMRNIQFCIFDDILL